jgi:hypothetical protein
VVVMMMMMIMVIIIATARLCVWLACTRRSLMARIPRLYAVS